MIEIAVQQNFASPSMIQKCCWEWLTSQRFDIPTLFVYRWSDMILSPIECEWKQGVALLGQTFSIFFASSWEPLELSKNKGPLITAQNTHTGLSDEQKLTSILLITEIQSFITEAHITTTKTMILEEEREGLQACYSNPGWELKDLRTLGFQMFAMGEFRPSSSSPFLLR